MKNRKILAIVLIVLFITMFSCILSGCTKKGENMLTTDNGVFRYDNLTSLKSDWTLTTADSISDMSKIFTMNANEESDQYSVTINTTDSGWAQIGQKVKLTQGQYYRITYSVDITKIAAFTSGNSYDGVYVSFLEDEDFNYSTDVKNDTLMQTEVTNGTYTLGFKAKSGGTATIQLNVGSKKYPTTANVILKKFTLERVDKSALVVNDAGAYISDYYGVQSDFNTFYIVMGAFAILLIAYFAYFAFQRHLYYIAGDERYNGISDGKPLAFAVPGNVKYSGFLEKIHEGKYLGLILVGCVSLFIGLIVNILSTSISAGYIHSIMGYNLEGLTTQAVFIAKYGTADMLKYLSEYAADAGNTYSIGVSSPLQLYVLGFCGLLGRIFEGTGQTYVATMFFVRLICLLADVATTMLIFIMIRKSVGNMGATIIAGAYSILPVVFSTSALWGYMDSITVFLILLTVYFMLKNKYVATAITYFVACMFSMTALFIAPFILFYTVMQCVIDVKKVIPASVILVMGFVVFYALNVPFDIQFINAGKPFYCYSKAWTELFRGALYARNAFNFQSILGNNFAKISTASTIVTIIFIIFLLTLAGVAYFKYRNRMNLMLLATAFINMLFVFGNNMNPVSMYISLALMLVYAIMNKEKRIYFSFIVFAILMFVNVSYSELFIEYTTDGVGIIGKVPLMYVFASIEIVMALYYVYIVYDIVVSRKVRKINAMPLSYLNWLKNLGLRIKKSYYKSVIKLQKKG